MGFKGVYFSWTCFPDVLNKFLLEGGCYDGMVNLSKVFFIRKLKSPIMHKVFLGTKYMYQIMSYLLEFKLARKMEQVTLGSNQVSFPYCMPVFTYLA